jgi:hypothetical protein
VGSGVDNTVYALAANSVFLYVGGKFANAGGKPSNFFGRWGAYQTLYLPMLRK